MPKVPGSDYVSSTQVPGSAPFEQASPENFSLVDRTITAGAKNIEATGMLAQRHVQYIEAEKARQNQVDMVMGKINDATRAYGDLEQKLKFGYTDPATNTTTPPVGSANYVSAFDEGVSKIHEDTLADVNDPQAKTALSIGLKRLYDSRLAQAQHFSTNLHTQEQEAEDITKGTDAANLAATAPSPEDRDAAINTYLTGIDLKYGNSRPKYVEALRKQFTAKTNTAFMEHQARTDPMGTQIMFEKGAFKDVPVTERDRILDQTTSILRAEDTRRKQLNKDIHDVYIREDFAPRANLGQISNTEMELVRTGQHPIMLATEYQHWKHINDTANSTVGTNEINTLWTQYGLTNGTPSDIATFRQRLVDLQQQLGGANPLYRQFAEKMTTDWYRFKNSNSQAIAAELRALDAGVKADAQTKTGIGFIDAPNASKDAKLENAARKQIIQGGGNVTADQMLKNIREQKAKLKENLLKGVGGQLNNLGQLPGE